MSNPDAYIEHIEQPVPVHAPVRLAPAEQGTVLTSADSVTDVFGIPENEYSEVSAPGLLHTVGRFALRTSMLAAAVTTYAWEQSPENEKFRSQWAVKTLAFGNRLFEHIDIRAISIPGKALVVGAVVAGITIAVESVTGVVTAATISQKDGMLGKFNSGVTKLASKLEVTGKDGKPKGDAAIALAGGAAPLVIKRHAEAGGERTFKENAKSGVRAAVGIGAFSGGLGAAASVAIDTADTFGHTAGALETIDFVSKGSTWWGLYGYILGCNLVDKAFTSTGQRVGAWYYSRQAQLAPSVQTGATL